MGCNSIKDLEETYALGHVLSLKMLVQTHAENSHMDPSAGNRLAELHMPRLGGGQALQAACTCTHMPSTDRPACGFNHATFTHRKHPARQDLRWGACETRLSVGSRTFANTIN